MLDGKITIDAYLENQELEYPEFSRRMAQVLRERRKAGTRLVQVEPFIDLLLSIHDRFANGDGPQDLPAGTDLYRVYCARTLCYQGAARLFTLHPAVTTSTPRLMLSSALPGPMPAVRPARSNAGRGDGGPFAGAGQYLYRGRSNSLPPLARTQKATAGRFSPCGYIFS